MTAGTLNNARLSTSVFIDRGVAAIATDWNTYTTQGTYRVGDGSSFTGGNNQPVSAYAFGTLVVNTSGNSTTQTYYMHNGTGALTRTKWNASDWTAWQTIWTASNDGVASGLDADLLDGNSSSYFQDASNLNAGTISSARLTGSYSGITGTGALAAGSIASGFGTIATGSTIQGSQLISTVATGTAPLTIASTTKVTNLNADLLDGLDSTAFGDATAANQTTILNRIGTNADAAGTTTVFARLASIDTSKLGTTADAASSNGTIFARLAYLISSIGATNDAASSTGSVNAKLAYLIANPSSGKTFQSAEFTTSTSWVAPAGVTKVEVFMVGGGGGGGTGTSSSPSYGGCGGGGGGIIKKYVTVTPSTSYPITIGAGGAGGTGSSVDGSAGGSSTFAGLTAGGGGGGGKANPDCVVGIGGSGGGSGGNGYISNGTRLAYGVPGLSGTDGFGGGGGGGGSTCHIAGQMTQQGGATDGGARGCENAVANRGGGGGGGGGYSGYAGWDNYGNSGGSGFLLIGWWQ